MIKISITSRRNPMSEEKTRYCKYCGKKLIDEKIFCRRCVLEGRNTTGKVAGIIGGVGTAVLSAVALLNNDSGNDSGEA